MEKFNTLLPWLTSSRYYVNLVAYLFLNNVCIGYVICINLDITLWLCCATLTYLQLFWVLTPWEDLGLGHCGENTTWLCIYRIVVAKHITTAPSWKFWQIMFLFIGYRRQKCTIHWYVNLQDLATMVVKETLYPLCPDAHKRSGYVKEGTLIENFNCLHMQTKLAMYLSQHNKWKIWRVENQSGLTHKCWVSPPPNMGILLKCVSGAAENVKISNF